jgi:5'-nucleotidase
MLGFSTRPEFPAAQQQEPGSPRAGAPVTILQLNDVYSTVPVDGLGGLARVATLKRQLVDAGRMPLLLLAGDFLSSSVASAVFQGEQMIAALNTAGVDMATLGNHELDFGVDVLIRRMAEAKFQWIVSNIIDGTTGLPIGGAAPRVVRTVGPLKVGFFGLSETSGVTARDGNRLRAIDPLEAAAAQLAVLENEGVDLIVALTHLSFAEDRELAERFPEIDLIVGGHEHFPIAAVEGRTLISKAGTEARFVARIDLARRAAGTVERFYELIPITGALADDPATAAVVASYESRLGSELEVVVGRTRVPLDGEEVRLRASETNLGSLVADAIRAEAAAEIAIVNAGGIRGNRIHAPGPLTKRSLLELLPFGNVVCKLAVPGRVILAALNNGVSGLPAADGRFPQVSGMSVRVDARAPPGSRIQEVRVNGEALDLDRVYTIAIPDFLYNGGDGYAMFAGQRVLIEPDSGPLMVIALEKHISGQPIAPSVDGRILMAQ